MTKETTNRPTHGVYMVAERKGKRAFWTKIGAAWPNQDGKGYSFQLDALPVNGRMVMRELTADEAEEGGA